MRRQRKRKIRLKNLKLFGNLSFHVEKPTKIKVNTETTLKETEKKY